VSRHNTEGEGGELWQFLNPDMVYNEKMRMYTGGPTAFTEPTAQRLFRGIAAGVDHMHKLGCYHRDLKIENIVLTTSFECKIIDFGYVGFVSIIVAWFARRAMLSTHLHALDCPHIQQLSSSMASPY
jgi:serine/threonine protein kinase